MSPMKVPLSDLLITDEDIATVAEVYRSGWLSMGPRTQDFEEALAGYVGARHAIAVSSGTAALHLICVAAGLGPGDEVIVPSLTFVATANAVTYTGARPVFADISSVSEPWLSADAAESAITPATKAILNVSYGGHSGDIEPLRKLCLDRGVLLLEDAAHALGSRLAGRHLGTYGRAGALSFYSNKNLAIGEGGAVVTDDDDIAERIRLLRAHGLTSVSWERRDAGVSEYDVAALGFNYRIDEPRAALATTRLARLEDDNACRAELDARYRAALEPQGVQCVLRAPDELRPSHYLFCTVCEPGVDRDAFRRALAARGVQTSLHYPPVHRLSVYRGERAELPATDDYARRSVTLPLFAHMTEEQQDLVIEAVRAAIAGSR